MATKEQLDLLIKVSTENAQSIKGLEKQINDLTSSLKGGVKDAAAFNSELLASAGTAAAALAPLAAVVGALGLGIKQAGDFALKLADTNEQIENAGKASRVSAENLTAVGLAAEQAGLGGLSTAAGAFNKLRRAQDEAAQGSQENLDALNNLAGGAANLDDVNVLFEQIAKNVNETGGAAAHASDIIKAFGRDGLSSIGPLFETFADAKEQAKEFGILIEGQVAASARKLDSAVDELNSRLKGAATIAGGEFADAFTEVAKAANDAIKVLSDPDIAAGLKEVAKFGSIVIKDTLIPLIALASKVAGAFSDIGNSLKLFKEFVTGSAEKTKETATAVEDLGTKAEKTGGQIEGLSQKVSNLSKSLKAATDIAEADANLQIQAFEKAAKEGIISEEDAAQRIGKIRADLAQRKVDDAFRAFAVVKEQLEKEEAAVKDQLDAIATRQRSGLGVDAGLVAEKEKLEKRLADFKTKIANDLFTAQAALRNAAIAQRKTDADTEEKELAAIVKRREDAIKRIDQAEAIALQKLTQRLTELALNRNISEQEKTKQTEQIEKERLDIVAANAQKRVDAEQEAVNDIKKANIDLKDGIFDANFKLTDGLIGLSKKRADVAIAEAKREREATQRIAEDIKQTDERIRQERELRDAKQNAFQAEVDQIKNAEDLAHAQTDVALATAAVNAELDKFRQQNLSGTIFDPDKLDEAKARLKDLQELYDGLIKSIQTQGFSALKQAAADATLTEIEDLFTKISNAERDALNKMLLDQQNARIASATETAAAIAKIQEDARAKEAELDAKAAKLKDDAIKDTESQQNAAAAERVAAQEKENQAIADENERFRQQEADREQKAADDAVELAIETAARERKVKEDAAQDELDRQIGVIVQLSQLNEQLAEKRKELAKAGLTPEDQAKILADIKNLEGQIAGVQGQSAKDADRAKRKQAAIDKAIAESKTKEEADIRIAGINAEFKDEEDLDKALAALGKNADAATIAAIKALFAQKKVLRDAEIASELADLAALDNLKAQQRARERQAEIDAHNDRLNDAKDAYTKDIEAINTRNNAILTAIATRLTNELNAIKAQRAMIEAQAQAQAAEILKQIGIVGSAADKFTKDLNANFNSNIEVVKALIEELKKLGSTVQNLPTTPGGLQGGGTTGSTQPGGLQGGGPKLKPRVIAGGSNQTANQQGAFAGFQGGFGDTSPQDFFGAGANNGTITVKIPDLVDAIDQTLTRRRGEIGANRALNINIAQQLGITGKVDAVQFAQMVTGALLQGDGKQAVGRTVRQINKAIENNDFFERRGSLTPPPFNAF